MCGFQALFEPNGPKDFTVNFYAKTILLYPLIPLLASPATTCEAGMPAWAYIIYAPLLFLTKMHELYMIYEKGYGSKKGMAAVWWALTSLAFWLGMLEHADWFTDGGFPVQAYKCGHQATNAFGAAFQESWMYGFAPTLVMLNFWGVATLLLT